MKSGRLFFALLACSMLLAFGFEKLQAQVTTSPLKLVVSKVEMSVEVTLAWTKPDSLSFTKYYVWQNVVTPTPNSPTIIDSTGGGDHSIEVTLPPSPVGGSVMYMLSLSGVLANGSQVASNPVQVQLNGIPPMNAFRLEAKITDNKRVKLNWSKPAQVTVTSYDVYRTSIGMMSTAPILPGTLIATTSDTAAIDSTNSTTGYVVYYVVAHTSLNVSLTSTFAAVFFGSYVPADTVHFTSTPITSARVGVKYDYFASATSSDPTAAIQYSLGGGDGVGGNDDMMHGISINATTGELTFTPMQRGWLGVRIVAQSNKGGRAVQEFVITIAGGNGIIQGKVTDTLDNPLANVMIETFRRNSDEWFSNHTMTDSLGNYHVTNLDPGSYYLHANPLSHDYFPQWYNGANEAADATPIGITSDSTVVRLSNIKLRSRITLALKGTVSGSVTDTTGIAITDSRTVVVFVSADFALNDADDLRDFFDFDKEGDHRLDGSSRYVFKMNVDSMGKYSRKIPAGRYIAFAKSPGYSVDFYNGHSDLLSADVINVPPDVSLLPYFVNVNFTLAPLPPVLLGKISGEVEDTAKNAGVRARLIAFRDRWTTPDSAHFRFQRTYVTDTDSLGMYTFNDLLPGKYIVLAIPLGKYAPVFYSTGVQSLRWKDATRIDINGNSVTGINLFVQPMPDSAKGFTLVSGSVNSTVAGATTGAIVYASYANGSVAGYAFADSRGTYTISGLAPGSYTISADLAGFVITGSKQATPTYSSAGYAVPATASFAAQQMTSVDGQPKASLPTEYLLEQNYPNPFNPSTTISYALPADSKVVLKVYSILGQLVATLVEGQQPAGQYHVVFRAAGISSGIYFYQLKVGNSFVQTRKMLFLK